MSYSLDGLRVARARQTLGLTQAELAARAGIHRVTLTKIENGDANVSLDLLERLCGVLDRSRSYLLGEPEDVDPVEAAREMVGAALAKVASGMDELVDVVDLLNSRARAVSVDRVEASA